jgi:hypothetical protein
MHEVPLSYSLKFGLGKLDGWERLDPVQLRCLVLPNFFLHDQSDIRLYF